MRLKPTVLALVTSWLLAGYAQGQNLLTSKTPLKTRWADSVEPAHVLSEYPRPQLVRGQWHSLNGQWDFAITSQEAGIPETYGGRILVPFPLESALSQVGKPLMPDELLWYRKVIQRPQLKNGERVLLHFGAVDWQAWIFVNGKEAGNHTGGYTNFTFDITDLLNSGDNELVVKVYDPSDQGIGPHGKQVLNPANIYYTPSSGIWQTVWLEVVPAIYISDIWLTPDIDKGVLNATVDAPESHTVELLAMDKGKVIASIKGKPRATITLPIKNAKLWSPGTPFLYDLQVRLLEGEKTVDEVKSYFGMRKISIAKDEQGFDRIYLNNRPYFNLGTLDQGFWPDGLYTAPTDEALKFDIEAIKAMGFNTIRKHIKIEPARWYYWADRIGMLVWQDMVNPNQRLPEGAREAFEVQCKETLHQLHNYPCITTWVLFNEKWGQYDQERLTRWIKNTDPSRLVNGHSGEYLYVNEKLRSPSPNAYVEADMTDVHSYPDPMNAIRLPGKAQVLGEFGGIGVFISDHQWNANSAWGYVNEKPASLQAKYTIMNQHLQLLQKGGLSASIYTQPFDVEGEQNGLMTYDREVVKIPFDTLRKIHAALNPDMGIIPLVAAQNADLTEPGLLYSQLLQQYVNGNRQPQFLKKLSMMAAQVGDKPGAKLASSSYIATLKAPYSTEDLNYVLQVTNSTRDTGFAILKDHTEEVNSILGARQAEIKMMNLIYQDEIHTSVSDPKMQPDWNTLASRIARYGAPGAEILLRAKTIYFINHQDWDEFAGAATEYVSKFGQHISPEDLNKFSWTVFEHLQDSTHLAEAVEWSRLSLKGNNEPAFMDTQANLLYKLGRKREALALQQKAISLSGDASLKENLEKMKRGERTWPSL